MAGRFGVFHANGLGDDLLTLPSLRALTTAVPGRWTLVTAEGPAGLMFGDAGLAEIVQVPMVRPDESAGRTFDAALAAERLGRVECLVSLVPWQSESLTQLAALVRPAWSIGLQGGFDFTVGLDSGRHAADRVFAVVQRFAPGLALERFGQPPALPADIVQAAVEVREAVGRNRRLLVVHAETASADKQWAPDRFCQSLRQLAGAFPDLFVLVIGRRAPPFDMAELGEAGMAITDIALPFFLALIAQADAFLGVDSVGLHAADLWDVPAVGLFGPTRSAEWGLRFSCRGEHVDGDGGMDEIAVKQVVAAVGRVLRAPLAEVG